MKFQHATLDTCENHRGTIVVIDVLRAFSTAAYAFASGVRQICLVSNVDEAFDLKQRFPEALLMGEDQGLPVDGFDYGNSPLPFVDKNLIGTEMIQRTSAGTQGVVRSKNADVLLAASLCCAGATAQFIKASAPETITFVVTGSWSEDAGEEDRACADYVESLLTGQKIAKKEIVQRVRDSAAARKFLDPKEREFPIADLEYCLAIDHFSFAMPVDRNDDLLVMRPVAQ
jgi:2-phosphosulfolactate phosphatase